MVNACPEPFSNIVLSTIEDVATSAGLWLVLAHPATAAVVALCLLALAVALIALAWRMWRRSEVVLPITSPSRRAKWVSFRQANRAPRC